MIRLNKQTNNNNNYAKPSWILNPLITELKDQLDLSQPLYLDTETSHFFSQIKLIQVYQEHWSDVLIFDCAKVNLKAIYEVIKSAKVIVYNYSYDGACFVNDLALNHTPFENFDDPLLLSRLVFYKELEKFSLDIVMSYVLGFNPYECEGANKKALQSSFLSTPKNDKFYNEPTDQQLLYAATDVFYLPYVYNRVKEASSEYVYKLDQLFLKECLVWQRNGMPVIKSNLEKLKDQYLKEKQEIESLLPVNLNPNSPNQVRAYTGLSSTEDAKLAEFERNGNKEASYIRKARKLTKKLNFVERYSFPRIRGYYAPTAISGRARCSGSDLIDGTDNLMQTPRSMAGIWGFEDNDPRFLVHADFAQLEMRSVTCLTGDPILNNLFRTGEDLHIYAASKIFNKPKDKVTKDERFIGKMCNFSLLYGSGHLTFWEVLVKLAPQDIPVPSQNKVKEIVSQWKQLYPGIKAWHESAGVHYRKNLLINQTPNGRPFKAIRFTDWLGIQNQGLGAEVAKLALHYFVSRNPKAKFLSFVHDAFYIEANNQEEALIYCKEIADCMVCAWFESIANCKITDLPMPVDAMAGKCLAVLDEEPHVKYTAEGSYAYYQNLTSELEPGVSFANPKRRPPL